MNTRRFGLWLQLAVGGALMMVLWVLLVWAASRPALKALVDLTPQRTNSVDPATVALLRELRDSGAEVEFHQFYPPIEGSGGDDFQQKALQIRARLQDLTRTLLLRYQYLGGDAVKVFDYDFYRDAESTRNAVQRYDYKAQDGEVLVVAVRQKGKEPRFRKLSLVNDLAQIELPGEQMAGPVQRRNIPVLKDYRGEQTISSALKGLLVEGVPVAYLLQGYSLTLDQTAVTGSGYGVLFESLARLGFEVRELDLRQTSIVPPDAALVLVLEPERDFSERDANALFTYLQRGGRMFVNYSWSGVPDQNPDGGRFGELLGYRVGRQPVFHLIPDGGRTGGRGLDGDNAVARLQLGYAAPLHETTERWYKTGRALEVAGARELMLRGSGSIEPRPLLVTGDSGWLGVPGADGFPDNRAPRIQLRQFLVGVSCSVPADGDDAGATKPGMRNGELVVVSGVFCNNIGMRAGFGDFALNVCSWLAERKVLMDIAGGSYEARRIDVGPQHLTRIRDLLVYYVPGAFLALGALVWWRRRR